MGTQAAEARRMTRIIHTDSGSVVLTDTPGGVMVTRATRRPESINVACYSDDELRALGEALLAEAEKREARRP